MADKTAPEQERKIVEACNAGMSGREAGARFGVSRSSVTNILRRNGAPAPPKGRRPTHTLNHAAFDVVTPESAYWMGFLFADGCVADYKDGAPQVILDLGAKDHGHIEKFRDFLGSSHTISILTHKTKLNGKSIGKDGKRISSSFRVRSKRLVAALQAKGMGKKSAERCPTKDIEDSVDFWRGCVDGDGTVRVAIDHRGYGYEYASIILCGHIPILEKFQAFLARRGMFANVTDTASGIFQIRLMGAGALAIIKLLYGNTNTALDRKLKTAREILKANGQI